MTESFVPDFSVDGNEKKSVFIEEDWLNPSFILLNGEESAPKHGWAYIHEFIMDSLDDKSALHIVENAERRPFGQGTLESVYFLNRGVYWECITKGFTEVNIFKEREEKAVNGYGFELVCRVRKEEADNEKPDWVVDAFASIATEGGNWVHGDCIEFGEDFHDPLHPIMCVVKDSKWREPLKTSFGSMKFLQLVPLTKGEEEIAGRIGGARFIEWLFWFSQPIYWAGRPDGSDRWLWAHADESLQSTFALEGLRVEKQGCNTKITCPKSSIHPEIIAQTLIRLMQHKSCKWMANEIDLSIVWTFAQNKDLEEDPSQKSTTLYLSPDGIKVLYSLLTSFGEWAPGLSWPVTLEEEPKMVIDFYGDSTPCKEEPDVEDESEESCC